MRTIEITVAPNGQTTVQTKGFAGASCRDATRLLERALGEPSGEKLTAEFYLPQAAQERTSQR